MPPYFTASIILSLLSNVLCQGHPLGYTVHNGRTRLDGSSFGILGVNKTFDYVVVGGGTAGLTIASRLAEDPSLSIAVVEAGDFYEQENSNVSQVPAYAVQYSSASPSTIQPLVDWGIVTPPQPELNGREIHYTQGKCLGGGSCRNYLIYQRGNVGCYQEWADLVGDNSYTFDNILPYFQKSVNFTPPNYAKRGSDSPVNYNSSAFNRGGPLEVSYFNYYMPFSPYIKKALQALGMSEIAGANNGELIGFAEITASLDPTVQVRSSSETSFLRQAMAETTIQVYQSTLAKKIIFDDRKRATGVEVTSAGSTYTLSARKEVIVSAGVFKTPQLLMISGVGPAATLRGLDIPVVADLQGVGQNIIDHPFFDTTFPVDIQTQTQLTTNASFAAQAVEDYLGQQKGPLTASAGNYIGWEKLPQRYRKSLSPSTSAALAKLPSDWPELQYVPVPAAVSLLPNSTASNYISMSVVLMAPTSRGDMIINSTDAGANPVVNLGWLNTTTDQEIAIAGLRRARQLAHATGLVSGPEVMPGSDIESDEQILDFIRNEVRPIHHAVSSCKMGKPNDALAVVDSHSRVFGVRGLRIVDTSVFPVLPPGQIQATTYMLAEKIAAEILQGQCVGRHCSRP